MHIVQLKANGKLTALIRDQMRIQSKELTRYLVEGQACRSKHIKVKGAIMRRSII